LINHPDRKKYDLSSLQTALIGGSNVAPDLLKKLQEELNIKNVIVGYGNFDTTT
jgi:acyl-CoA synthetase (AMP-forming)/AMP-acid ligase II